MSSNVLAVSRIRGLIPLVWGPAASDWNRRLPPTPQPGIRATNSTTMPSPPSQWVAIRHMCSGAERRPSMSVRMVAPVVVKPEKASKRASAQLISAPITNGMDPNRPIAIQMVETTNKCLAAPSRTGTRQLARRNGDGRDRRDGCRAKHVLKVLLRFLRIPAQFSG